MIVLGVGPDVFMVIGESLIRRTLFISIL